MELQNENFNNLYVNSKIKFADKLLYERNKKVIMVYIYDTFGLRDKRNKLITIWLNQLIKNKPVTIYSAKTVINISSNKFVSKLLANSIKLNAGKYEIRSEIEMSLIELYEFLKKITNSKSELIIKNFKPIKIIKKYKNISDILKIKYTMNDFEKDLREIIHREFK